MRFPLRLLVLLCAMLTGVAFAQSPANSTVSKAKNPISFSYDAQHDQVIPSGVQLRPAAISDASITPTTGMVVVTINIHTMSHFRRDTSYHCALTVLGGELDTTNAIVSGGIDTAVGLAKRNGSDSLSCTLTIPYE